MARKSIFKTFMKYTTLNMLSMVGMSCYILADTLFIANGLGPLGLTALNLVLPIYNLIFGIGIMFGVGAATRFSILQSQDKPHEANQYFTQAFLLGIVVSLIFVFIGSVFPEDIVRLMGGDSEVLPLASEYLRVFILFTPFFVLNHIVLVFIRNDHNPKLASVAMLIGTLFNIVFDYIFIFPLHLGMFGAALATGFAPVVTLSICLLHFVYKKNNFSLVRTRLHFHHIRHFLTIGFPSFVTEFSGGIIIFVFNIVILTIGGNLAIASYGIVCNLALVVTSLYTGIAQGIQPLLSQCYGHKEKATAHLYVRYAVIMSLGLSACIYALLIFFPQEIISLFNNTQNPLINTIATEGLLIYFTGFFFVGINMIAVSYFTSIENIKPSLIISILRGGALIIPTIIILAQWFSLTGVWISFPFTEGIVLIIAYMLYKKSVTTLS